MDRIESHKIGNREVLVNRGDLQGDGEKYPFWGKIGAIESIFNSDFIKKDITLMHLNAYGSWTGWALGSLSKKYGIDFCMAYPASAKFPEKYLHYIRSMNVDIEPFKPNMDSLLRNKLRGICERRGFQFFNNGFDCQPFLQHFSDAIEEVVNLHDVDVLVVSGGSGITLSGLALGFDCYPTLFSSGDTKKIYAIVVSSEQGVRNVLKRKGIVTDNIEVIKSEYEFNDRMDWYETPFPINPFWDKKAWHWLEKNIDSIDGRILFWNLGGSDDFFV